MNKTSLIILLLVALQSFLYAFEKEYELIKISQRDTSKILMPFSNPFYSKFKIEHESKFRIEFWNILISSELDSTFNENEKVAQYTFDNIEVGKYIFLWYGIFKDKKYKGRFIYRIYINNKLINQEMFVIN